MREFTIAARFFKLGSCVLEDPLPDGSLDDVVRLLSRTFPQIRHMGRLYQEDGIPQKDGSLLFELPTIPLKVNG